MRYDEIAKKYNIEARYIDVGKVIHKLTYYVFRKKY